MQERRTAHRMPLKAKVRARLVDENGGVQAATACSGWTQDVSLGGVRFGARKPLPINSIVELDIDCKHPAEVFQLRGQVGWLCNEGDRGGFSVGVFIHEAARERVAAWRRMLERRGLAD